MMMMMMNSATASIPLETTTAISASSEPLQTITCVLQARIGGLDRVLGAITHRGWIPTQFQSVLCPKTDTLSVTMAFHSTDCFSVQKLVKFLEKQVYVLSANLVAANKLGEEPTLFAPIKQRSA
jgi:acetolactate synthase small subunit